MKLKGRKLSGANVETLVLPRGNGDGDIIIKAQAVLDMTEFATVLTPPAPPEVLLPGGQKSHDKNDPSFMAKVNDWATKRTHYMILKSLEATEGLEWESVDMKNPETWQNYITELTAAGFSDVENTKIIETVMRANALSERHLEEARKRFLASQAVAASS